MKRSRAVLAVRLRTLATPELANIIRIGQVVFAALAAPLSAANTVGYALVAGYLLIGAAYGAVKLRQLRVGLRRPPLIGCFVGCGR